MRTQHTCMHTLTNTNTHTLSLSLSLTHTHTHHRGLFYPFTIPYGTSYSCISHKDHIWSVSGNPNRFVPTKIPFDANAKNITDGPLLQFIGLQVCTVCV